MKLSELKELELCSRSVLDSLQFDRKLNTFDCERLANAIPELRTLLDECREVIGLLSSAVTEQEMFDRCNALLEKLES